MPKLPLISGKNLLRVLKKNGYREVRQKGSHVFIENPELEKGTIIPLHVNEDLGKGLLKSILNDLNMTVEDLIHLLK